MKYGLKFTFNNAAIEAYNGEHKEILKAKAADAIAEQIEPLLEFAEQEDRKARETHYTTDFVFMPAKHWYFVKKLLLALCVFSDMRTKQAVEQIIDEIENK